MCTEKAGDDPIGPENPSPPNPIALSVEQLIGGLSQLMLQAFREHPSTIDLIVADMLPDSTAGSDHSAEEDSDEVQPPSTAATAREAIVGVMANEVGVLLRLSAAAKTALEAGGGGEVGEEEGARVGDATAADEKQPGPK